MSTNAKIGIKLDTGEVKAIYSHWDGYIEGGVGETLYEYYKDKDKVKALIDLGDISSLGENIEKPEGHSFENKKESYTVAYHRDRGEDLNFMKFDSISQFWTQDRYEYNYLYKDGEWYVNPTKKLEDYF